MSRRSGNEFRSFASGKNVKDLISSKAKSLLKAGFFEFGSSDWTRTSDIRINSPPFYRLNYRGIVRTRRILTMPIHNVKACFLILKAFAEIFCVLPFIPTQLAFFHTFYVQREDISIANARSPSASKTARHARPSRQTSPSRRQPRPSQA